jgi:hypothetical protein
MMRLAIACVVLVAACSGKSTQDPQRGGDGAGPGPTVLAKKLVLSWGIQQATSAANVFVQLTDETGKQVSHPLGSFAGQCTTITPADQMKAISGVACKDGARGIELHAVARDGSIIVVEMRADDGVPPDPMAREELMRVKVPSGAAIEAASS